VDDVGATAMTTRIIVDGEPKSPKLVGRVHGVALAVVCVLVEERNDGTLGGVKETRDLADRKIGEVSVANASDGGLVNVREVDNPHVGATHATVGTAINEGTKRKGRRVKVGKMVSDVAVVHATVEVSADLDEVLV
jgi:hypothetical protein